MASLDPAALERELETLRRQRYEASQRVRASRQPLPVPTPQGRDKPAEIPSGFARPPLGTGRFAADRGLGGGPPLLRGDGPRTHPGSFRDGPLPGRLGSEPSPRGPPGGGFQDGPPRGRVEAGPGGRGPREYGEYGRDRDGGGAAATGAAAQPAPRRRTVLSMVVSDRPTQRDDAEENAKGQPCEGRDAGGGDAEGRDADRDRHWGRDRENDRDGRRQGFEEDRMRGWGRGGGGDEDRHRGDRGDKDGRGYGHGFGGDGRGVKRPAGSMHDAPNAPAGPAVAEDPDSRKRARRLLGRALLGTLQKFRQEDAQFQASDAAARRAELARKAEEKAAAEAERLRRQAAEERSRKRQEELEALMHLNLATDIKVLELLYAKKIARRRALAAFLRADGVPAEGGAAAVAAVGRAGGGAALVQPQPVYWIPASHCSATLAVKERQEKELREWEESVLADLELEKDGLRMRAQARRQGIAERRQRAEEARAAGGAVKGAAGEGREGDVQDHEAAEDHEALEALELDAHHDDVEEEELGGGAGGSDGGAAEAGGAREGDAAAAGEEPAADVQAAGAGKVEAMEAEGEAAAARDDSDSGAGDEMAA